MRIYLRERLHCHLPALMVTLGEATINKDRIFYLTNNRKLSSISTGGNTKRSVHKHGQNGGQYVQDVQLVTSGQPYCVLIKKIKIFKKMLTNLF